MFRQGHFHKRETINIVFNSDGMGDNVARMSAIKYLKDTFKFLTINLYVPDYFAELACNLVPGINVHRFSSGPKDYYKYPVYETKGKHTPMRTHVVDQAFHILCDMQPTDEQRNYCRLNLDKIDTSSFSLPEKYAIVCTGFTAATREMLPQTINEISKHLLSKGVTPVYLGSKVAKTGDKQDNIIGNFNNEIDYSLGIDLIDKTSLVQAGKIINGSKVIVGMDCGLLHLAGCTDVPIIGGFTTVNPLLRMPVRNGILGWNYLSVVPSESLKCRFCQSNWNFIYKVDFRFCPYVTSKQDTEIQCVKNLSSTKFIEKVNSIL